ncbi:hypothetical protein SAMN05216216_1141, partial [Lacicoccus qingdaonensis]
DYLIDLGTPGYPWIHATGFNLAYEYSFININGCRTHYYMDSFDAYGYSLCV